MKDSFTLNIGIIGYGYWGPNLVRNFSAVPNCRVVMVCDLKNERLQLVKRTYPSIEVTKNVDDIFNNPDIDAVIIATQVFTHYELGKSALTHGKSVLLEKPMTDSVAHAEELMEIADKHNKVLMVDHTFLYNGAVKKIKELVDKKDLGNLNYFDSTRINLGLIQQDINVLWDLAPHDISILNHLIAERPFSVQAVGISHIHSGIENIAYLTVNYNNGFIAHFNCSWSSPVKIRMMLLGGDKKMVVYNDMNQGEKIKVYDTGFKVENDEDKRDLLISYRSGDIFVPKIDEGEPLLSMAIDFANAIRNGTKPISDSHSGLWSVKVLEASQKSIKNKGIEVFL